MILSDKTVKEFRRIFREEYGVEWTRQEAHEAAHNLVSYFELLIEMDRENKKADKEKKA